MDQSALAIPRRNRTKAKLEAGEVPLGVLLFVPSPRLVEVCGTLGFDYVSIDVESAPVDQSLAEHLVRAAESVGITPMIRLMDHNPKQIQQYLDAGFQGIVAPNVDSAEQARRIVAAAKYPPEGVRGLGPARAAWYGHAGSIAEFAGKANDEIMVIGIIEDVAALDEIGEILATPGFDAFNIGVWDLSTSMGLPVQTNHPRVKQAVDTILAEAAKIGRVIGYAPGSAEDARQRLAEGYRLFNVSFNSILGTALRGVGAEIREAIAAAEK